MAGWGGVDAAALEATRVAARSLLAAEDGGGAAAGGGGREEGASAAEVAAALESLLAADGSVARFFVAHSGLDLGVFVDASDDAKSSKKDNSKKKSSSGSSSASSSSSSVPDEAACRRVGAALVATAKWRAVEKPETIDLATDAALREELRVGRVVLLGRDGAGRLLLLVRGALHDAQQRDLAAVRRLVLAILEHSACERNPKLSLVFDQRGLSRRNSDAELRGALLADIQAHYPERLAHVAIVNSPFVFRAVWAVVKPMLDPATRAKVSFVKDARKIAAKGDASAAAALPTDLGGEADASDGLRLLEDLLTNSCRLEFAGTGIGTTENPSAADGDDDDETNPAVAAGKALDKARSALAAGEGECTWSDCEDDD